MQSIPDQTWDRLPPLGGTSAPEDDQLLSPFNDPWYVPRQHTPEILDVPPQIMPQT